MRPVHVGRLKVLLSALLAIGAFGSSGCGSDDVGPQSRMVGGRCTTGGDCVQRCLTGAAFPGGYCTVTCTNSNDCPGGSACVASNGGICLATCQVATDCADFGPGYRCSLLTSQSGGGGSRVCVGS